MSTGHGKRGCLDVFTAAAAPGAFLPAGRLWAGLGKGMQDLAPAQREGIDGGDAELPPPAFLSCSGRKEVIFKPGAQVRSGT